MSDYRCTTCGGVTNPVIRSSVGQTSTEATYKAFDDRYTIRWCPWCKRSRESVLADSVKEAVANVRTAKDPPDQIKGGW